MKIADFFVALGFKIDGEPEVDKTDKAVEKLTFSSVKLLAAVTALNAAFFAIMKNGVEAGVALQRFALTTGLSAEELQREQAQAVRFNVSAGQMAVAIGTIQKARAAIAFGNAEAAAPWMLLGIDPRKDPFKVLEDLRRAVLKLDPAIARQKLSEMGFSDDILFLLKQPGFGAGGLNRGLVITDAEATRLATLGGAWKSLLFTLGQVGARFAAQFAEPIAAVINQLGKALTLVGQFVDWLERGSGPATAFKYAFLGVVTALIGLNVALGAFILGPGGVFVALLGTMALLLGGLVFLVQDFWVACRGGKSAFDWNDGLLLTVKNVERLAHAIEWVVEKFKTLSAIKDTIGSGGMFDLLALAAGNPGPLITAGGFSRPDGGNVSQTNHVAVTVQGGPTPVETGRAVGRGASREISDAFAQLPAPTH